MESTQRLSLIDKTHFGLLEALDAPTEYSLPVQTEVQSDTTFPELTPTEDTGLETQPIIPEADSADVTGNVAAEFLADTITPDDALPTFEFYARPTTARRFIAASACAAAVIVTGVGGWEAASKSHSQTNQVRVLSSGSPSVTNQTSTAPKLTNSPSSLAKPKSSPDNQPTLGSGVVVVPKVTPSQANLVKLNCLEPQASANAQQEQACQQVFDGTIAVVDFGAHGSGNQYRAEDVAVQATKYIKMASGGLISQQGTVIVASAAAQKKLKQIEQVGPDGVACIPASLVSEGTDGNGKSPEATIARETMPGLSQYNLIVGIGTEVCSDNNALILGSANPAQLTADVYTPSSPNGTPESDTSDVAMVFAHEVGGHESGLGHSGSITNPSETPSILNTSTQPINLDSYFDFPATYDPYGNKGNVMSNDPSPTEKLSILQRDFLAQVVSSREQTHGAPLTATNAQVITPSTPSAEQTYATLPLPANEIKLQSLKDAGFTQLDFLANTSTDATGAETTMLTVMANTSFTPSTHDTTDQRMMREVKMGDFNFLDSGTLRLSFNNSTIIATLLPDASIQLSLEPISQ